ncbi:MAG: hypothetical protein ACLU8S_00445 [Coprococcus phoceensis]
MVQGRHRHNLTGSFLPKKRVHTHRADFTLEDEYTNHVNTFYNSLAPVCVLQMGAFLD